VLVALLAALAAPLLHAPAPAGDPVADVVARARRLAVERAEPLALDVRADGRWRVASVRTLDATLLAGRIPAPQRPLSLALSPLGLCVPSDALAWDPARCEPVAAATSAP